VVTARDQFINGVYSPKTLGEKKTKQTVTKKENKPESRYSRIKTENEQHLYTFT